MDDSGDFVVVIRTGWVSVPAGGHRDRDALVSAHGLPYRGVEALLCERGTEVDQVTILPVGTDRQLSRPGRLAMGVGRQRDRDSPLQDHRHHP